MSWKTAAAAVVAVGSILTVPAAHAVVPPAPETRALPGSLSQGATTEEEIVPVADALAHIEETVDAIFLKAETDKRYAVRQDAHRPNNPIEAGESRLIRTWAPKAGTYVETNVVNDNQSGFSMNTEMRCVSPKRCWTRGYQGNPKWVATRLLQIGRSTGESEAWSATRTVLEDGTTVYLLGFPSGGNRVKVTVQPYRVVTSPPKVTSFGSNWTNTVELVNAPKVKAPKPRHIDRKVPSFDRVIEM